MADVGSLMEVSPSNASRLSKSGSDFPPEKIDLLSARSKGFATVGIRRGNLLIRSLTYLEFTLTVNMKGMLWGIRFSLFGSEKKGSGVQFTSQIGNTATRPNRFNSAALSAPRLLPKPKLVNRRSFKTQRLDMIEKGSRAPATARASLLSANSRVAAHFFATYRSWRRCQRNNPPAANILSVVSRLQYRLCWPRV